MRGVALWVLCCALAACERSNPAYCDGVFFFCGQRKRCDLATRSCVDVAPGAAIDCERSASCPEDLPLCDQEARVCRACAAGEDRRCAERDPRTPRCLASRCVECITPPGRSQEVPECTRRQGGGLATPVPVCETATNTCRPCRLHAECVSGVCAKDDLSDALGVPRGSCVPEDQVLVVDPSLCSAAGPVFCTPRQAVERLDRQRRYVVFRRSAREEDFSEIEIGRFENQGLELYLIGPLADGPPAAAAAWPQVEIGAPGRRGFIVHRKSRVTLEGFLIHRASVGVQCYGDGPGTLTQVRVLRSLISGNAVGLAIHNECRLVLEQSWVGRGPQSGPLQALSGNDLAVDITRSDFVIRNVVFTDNGDIGRDRFGGIRITGGLGGGREGKRISSVVNSTFYGHNAWVTLDGARYTAIVCDSPVGGRLAVVNTLFFQDPRQPLYERYVAPSCGGQIWHVASDDPTLVGNMSVVFPRTELPGFRDAAARDFHIGRAADASALWRRVQDGGLVQVDPLGLRAPEDDMDGAPRARPEQVSIGAYEVEP